MALITRCVTYWSDGRVTLCAGVSEVSEMTTYRHSIMTPQGSAPASAVARFGSDPPRVLHEESKTRRSRGRPVASRNSKQWCLTAACAPCGTPLDDIHAPTFALLINIHFNRAARFIWFRSAHASPPAAASADPALDACQSAFAPHQYSRQRYRRPGHRLTTHGPRHFVRHGLAAQEGLDQLPIERRGGLLVLPLRGVSQGVCTQS